MAETTTLGQAIDCHRFQNGRVLHLRVITVTMDSKINVHDENAGKLFHQRPYRLQFPYNSVETHADRDE